MAAERDFEELRPKTGCQIGTHINHVTWVTGEGDARLRLKVWRAHERAAKAS